MAVSDNTDYNEMANLNKVKAGLNSPGNRFRNAEHRPKLRFEDDESRSNTLGQDRNDIPKLPIVDSWKAGR